MKDYDSKKDTMEHIKKVKKNINVITTKLKERSARHDSTKLEDPEKAIFDEYTPKLKDSTYMSAEYTEFLSQMKPALDHHYFHNRHHPEYFEMGPEANCGVFNSALERMNLVDIIEMFCDWLAATERHADGDIYKSIELNQKRFGYSDELKMIFERTANLFKGEN